MKGTGQAVAHGAISILNAFATGKGGAMGIDLWTRARVSIQNGGNGIRGYVSSDPKESSALVVKVVEKTLEYYGHRQGVSGEVVTSSNIPIAVGLKSSSAAANAAALATVSALGKVPNDDAIIDINIASSIESGVSLTGAFDDSYASYHGGAVLTDNSSRKIERTLDLPRDIRVLILVPSKQTHTGSLSVEKFAGIKTIVEAAYREAIDGHVWDALTINGLAYSSVLGENQAPVLAALEAGAFGAGLTGKGPAIAAVVSPDHLDGVKRALGRFDAKLIEAAPNTAKATIET
jgi:shikimate kinase